MEIEFKSGADPSFSQGGYSKGAFKNYMILLGGGGGGHQKDYMPRIKLNKSESHYRSEDKTHVRVIEEL